MDISSTSEDSGAEVASDLRELTDSSQHDDSELYEEFQRLSRCDPGADSKVGLGNGSGGLWMIAHYETN